MSLRAAGPGDAEALVALRVHCFEAMGGDPWPVDGAAVAANTTHLTTRLAEDALFHAVVVEDDATGVVVGCAVGWLNRHLPTPSCSSGLVGYVGQVATSPAHRERGVAEKALAALLDWFRERGAATAQLHATPDGAGLFEHLGFTAPSLTAMTLRLDDRGRPG